MFYYSHKKYNYFILLIFTFLVINLFGCASSPKRKGTSYKVLGTRYYPISHSDGFVQKGIASWYGKDFHGKKTASGEIYNMNLRTAAHKILPLGTYVKVKNLENGRATVVRINDRGPFVDDRIIDLSYAAGKEIGINVRGIAKVKIEALDKNDARSISHKNFNKGFFTIQVASLRNKKNADRLYNKLKRMYRTTHMNKYNSGGGTYYRIRVGKFFYLDKADKAKKELIQRGYKGSKVVAEKF